MELRHSEQGFRENFSRILDIVYSEDARAFVTRRGEVVAVLLSAEDYGYLRDRTVLLEDRLAQAEKAVGGAGV